MPVDLEWLLKPPPIAHRGLHDLARGIPENSLAAFARCVDHRVPIELDVHLLADGKVAVFHDDGLLRATGVYAPVEAATAAALRGLRLFATAERIPLIEDVLDLVAGRVPILIELKSRGAAGALEAALLKALEAYRGPFAVQSFAPATVRWFKAHAPQVARGQLSGSLRAASDLSALQIVMRRAMLTNLVTTPHFIGYEFGYLDAAALRLWARLGIPVIVWTVRSARDAAALPAFVRNYIFEGFWPAMPS